MGAVTPFAGRRKLPPVRPVLAVAQLHALVDELRDLAGGARHDRAELRSIADRLEGVAERLTGGAHG